VRLLDEEGEGEGEGEELVVVGFGPADWSCDWSC